MESKMTVIVRVLLGLIFLSAGLNGYVVLFGFEPFLPTSPEAMALLGTGYLLALLKTVELLAGLLLLFRRAVPLALMMLAGVVVNILAFHLFADPELLAFGVIVFVLEAYLIWVYRERFLPLLSR